MVKVFDAMENITVTELRTLKSAREAGNQIEPDDAFIDLDFSTEDFINKNIRVRPISGVTNQNEETKTNVSGRHDDNED